ncbi:MAG: patatin-like phospholipase family protein [Terriglobales bacterium]|jgi:NTE family protein
MEQRALVLGAGGHAATAWELGVITGMADAGVDVRNADVIVGTSAGARVAVLITSDLTLEELFQQQVDSGLQTKEPAPPLDFTRWRTDFMRAKEGSGEAIGVLQRFGALALQTPGDLREARRNMIATALPLHTWPERQLLIVAVDVESGERRAFDRSSGVDLIDAVAASGAVPGIWPPVEVRGHRYMDGGMYSIDNADLAVGRDHVVILTLPARIPPLCVASLEDAVDTLRHSGARVDVVHPDEAAQAAFASVGGNLLDPSVREAAARAGREQGQRVGAAGARI